MWNLKKKRDTNELICRTQTDSQTLKTNIWFPKKSGGGKDGWGICEWHMDTLVYGITDLLYSTENSIQYSVIIYMGKKSEKEWMCVHVYLNHFVILLNSRNYHSIVNQLYFNKTFKNGGKKE